jgi:hypothetical protein
VFEVLLVRHLLMALPRARDKTERYKVNCSIEGFCLPARKAKQMISAPTISAQAGS